jgi:hypothetical protein
MRVPGRLHVAWDGDSVLKIETDAGKQTRLLTFDRSGKPAGDRTWQGFSIAEWETAGGRGGGAGRAAPGRVPQGGDDEHARRLFPQERRALQ